MQQLDETHDPARRSWVTSANGHPDFPIQNLPYSRFSVAAGAPRPGFALGDKVIDLVRVVERGLLEGESLAAAGKACSAERNALIGLGSSERRVLRRSLSALFAAGDTGVARRAKEADPLYDAARCTFHLPADIGDYTDFNAGIHHAANGGRRRGLHDPLLPNYRHVPIAYHGRASSVQPSDATVRRPHGQTRPDEQGGPARFGPSAKLDFELELGIWIAHGNELGETIPIGGARDHIAGYSLLNDWSARDIQGWESERLGPFLGKSFLTTVSPWVITPEALEPFRHAAFERSPGEPGLLPYLDDRQDRRDGAFSIALEVWLCTPRMRVRGVPAQRIALSDSRHLYWTAAQMVAHHASNGCNLRPGDLLGTGTISGPEPEAFGSMLELSWDGAKPLVVAEETRRFLEDGDEVTLCARAERDGFVSIGFGECAGRISPAAGVAS